tara:strand:+ start:534 stop:839 length:306 start_codon:yes stop_codon:yes gene_type:complete
MLRFIILFTVLAILNAKNTDNKDLLILNKGVRYVGNFLGSELGKIKFSPINSFNFTSPIFSEVKLLVYRGQIIIKNGECLLHKNKICADNKVVDKSQIGIQ